ncbi:putative ATP-dependent DNA helicase Q1 [Branchiostoma floridae x Branchiostoma belcheri]
MEDQIREASKLGVSATQLGEDDEGVVEGKYMLVFGGPERWVLQEKWREVLSSATYRENLVGLVVDEVHVTYKWGEGSKGKPAFREAFSKLGELRSLVKEDTPIVALTASADTQSRERVISLLNMQGAKRISVSPNRQNIRLGIVKVMVDKLNCLDWVAKLVRDNGVAAPHVIIYCRKLKTLGKVFTYLQAELGEDMWVDRDPEHRTKNCFVGNYHSNTLPQYKEHVISSLNGNGNCRVVVATNALGMGMNFPNVSYVVMYGPPKDAESILQEVGRAGRNGSPVDAVVYYHGAQLVKVDKAVKDLMTTDSNCLRKSLYGLFEENTVSVEPGHRCCSYCHRTCKCAGEGCEESYPPSESCLNIVKLPTRYREVDSEQRDLVRELLHEYQAFLLLDTTHLYTNPEASTFFTDKLIECVVDSCTHLFDINYISTHLPVFRAEHAQEILRIMYEVFGDIDYVEPSFVESFAEPDMDYAGYFDFPEDCDDETYSLLFDSDSDFDDS